MIEIEPIDQQIVDNMIEKNDRFFTRKRTLIAILIFITLLVIGLFIRFLYPRSVIAPEISQADLVGNHEELFQSEPTPFAFEELTIPYLRNREYVSNISDLTQISSNQSYISYLTSYDSDGLNVNGLITIPKTQMPVGGFPAIVFVHGYIPPTLYRTENNYASYVDYFAKRGFVVFKVDLRGHDKSEGQADGAYYDSGYVIDVLNAYSALQEMDLVDSSRIGLWGHSMAGNVVFRALVVKKDIPKVVIWAGAVYTYSDFSEYGIDDNSYRPPLDDSQRRKKRQELFDLYGEFNPNSWFWSQVPGTNYLDGVTGSLQVHHAVNDDVVNVGFSRGLMNILDNTQIEHELFEYSIGGHNIEGLSFSQAMQRSVDFLIE